MGSIHLYNKVTSVGERGRRGERDGGKEPWLASDLKIKKC